MVVVRVKFFSSLALLFGVLFLSACTDFESAAFPEEAGFVAIDGIAADDFEVRFGTQNDVDFLYGGDSMTVGYLARTQNNSPFCTATLIRPTIVLTAAHCLNGLSSLSQIHFSIDPSWPAGTRVSPNRVIFFTNSFNQVAVDMVVLRLPESYATTLRRVNRGALGYGPQQQYDYIRALNSRFVASGSAAVALGFGVNQSSSNTAMRRSGAVVVSRYVPDTLFPQTVLEVLPGSASQVICNGDSGGPLLIPRPTPIATDISADTGLYPAYPDTPYVIAGVASSVRSTAAQNATYPQICAGVVSSYYVPLDRYLGAVQTAIDMLQPAIGGCTYGSC
jgi:hypothetical protein